MASVIAQENIRTISLAEAIDIAGLQSLEAKEAGNIMYTAYWEYRNFKAELKPNILLSANVPTLKKSLELYQNQDGSYQFISQRLFSGDVTLEIDQNISLTGGKISIVSQLERFEYLGSGSSSNYLSVPMAIVLQQPIISYNPLKWSKKIEPIKYTQAKKQYFSNIETVSVKTVDYYFDLLSAEINIEIARNNVENSSTLYEIALGKKKLGIISDNDLKQLEFSKLNASGSLILAQQDYMQKMYALRTYLRLSEDITIKPEIPQPLDLYIDYERFIGYFNANNPFMEDVQRRLLELDRNIAQAKSDRGYKFDIYASIGYTGTNSSLPKTYTNFEDRQLVTIGIRIPILDWGKGRGGVELAKSQRNLEQLRIERQNVNIEQDIKQLVWKANKQKEVVELFRKADEIAQERYRIAFDIFKSGQLSVLDINTAQMEQNEAKRNYLNHLYLLWLYYYNTRQISLYDFVNKQELIDQINESEWIKKFLKER